MEMINVSPELMACLLQNRRGRHCLQCLWTLPEAAQCKLPIALPYLQNLYQTPRPITMKKELIQTRNRKMNKKMIVKHEELEEDWTNNEDWLQSYTMPRNRGQQEVEVLEQWYGEEEVHQIGEEEEEEEDNGFDEAFRANLGHVDQEDDDILISGSPTVASPEAREEELIME